MGSKFNKEISVWLLFLLLHLSNEIDVEDIIAHIEGGTYESSREPIPSIS